MRKINKTLKNQNQSRKKKTLILVLALKSIQRSQRSPLQRKKIIQKMTRTQCDQRKPLDSPTTLRNQVLNFASR
jgi:hypothetical protein